MAEQTNLVERFKTDAQARIDELAPMVTEHSELVETLGRVNGEGATAEPEPAQEPKATPSSAPRSKRSGGRRDQFVKLVADNPGITVSEAAKQMKIQPNYLYRVAAEAVKDGGVKVEGRQYTVA